MCSLSWSSCLCNIGSMCAGGEKKKKKKQVFDLTFGTSALAVKLSCIYSSFLSLFSRSPQKLPNSWRRQVPGARKDHYCLPNIVTESEHTAVLHKRSLKSCWWISYNLHMLSVRAVEMVVDMPAYRLQPKPGNLSWAADSEKHSHLTRIWRCLLHPLLSAAIMAYHYIIMGYWCPASMY